MALPSRHARVALLAPLLVGTACAGSSTATCSNCDAGPADAPIERAAERAASEAAVLPETSGEASPPADVVDTRPIATRDTASGEPRDPTPTLDGGYLFEDDFNVGEITAWQTRDVRNGVAFVGNWTIILGDAGSVISQGELDEEAWHVAFTVDDFGQDQIVEAWLRVVDFAASSPSTMAGIFGRYDPGTDSGYFFALRGDGSLTLRRRDHSTSSSWGGGVPSNIEPGTWCALRLEIIGNTLTAFLNGVQVYVVSDEDPLTSGHIGLGTFGASLEVDRVFAAGP
jgi:hypothetical protein